MFLDRSKAQAHQMYSSFQFLWLQTKFLHMISSAQACKSFQEGFHAEIFGSFKEEAGWVQGPQDRKISVYETSNQNCCFSLHFTVQSGRDLPDLQTFEPCPFKNRAHHSQANTHSNCTLMSFKISEVVEGKPRAQRAFEYEIVSKSLLQLRRLWRLSITTR